MQPALERVPRLPTELASNLRCIDCVSAVVTRAIGHEGLEGLICLPSKRWIRTCRPQLFQDMAQLIDNLEVRALVTAANIVFFAGSPPFEHHQQADAVIFH